MSEDRILWRSEGGVAGERWPALVPDSRVWLADEVAIDFPSVRSVVDRIRLAFLGDDSPSPAVLTEIRLSPREACDGALVPLVVPVQTTCSVCGGRGESWTETCRSCEGSGVALRSHRVRVSVPARVSDGTRFQFSLSTPHAPPTRVEVRVAIR